MSVEYDMDIRHVEHSYEYSFPLPISQYHRALPPINLLNLLNFLIESLSLGGDDFMRTLT